MHIDIYHDTVCPWCRIGKANLRHALQQWQGEAVSIGYKTFFLNPNLPEEGADFVPYMNAKVGGRIPLAQMFAGPREAGRRVGLNFNFEAISRAPNSTLSHMLIASAVPEQREALIDAIYHAYFEAGEDIGALDTLVKLAQSVGMSQETVHQVLKDEALRAQVEAEANEAHSLGITGVPFFIINQRYAFSGAQPPETILNVLQQVAQKSE